MKWELYNNFPIPEIAGLQPDSKINIQIKFTDIYIILHVFLLAPR